MAASMGKGVPLDFLFSLLVLAALQSDMSNGVLARAIVDNWALSRLTENLFC
jgi:hypothetical protein